MAEPRELSELRERLKRRLEHTRRLIAEYEETMDYASHCNLLGFAEGIEFVMEEIGDFLKEKDRMQKSAKSRREGKGASGKGSAVGKQKKPGAGKREAQDKSRNKRAKGVTG